MGSHSLLQEIFLTQGSDLGLLHWQADSLPSEPPGKPKPHLFLIPQLIYFRVSQNEISGLQASKSMSHLLNMQVSGPVFRNDQITVSEGCLCSVAESHLTLCGSMEGSPPGSSVHGISQGRRLEWVSISSSRGSS